MKVIAMDMSGSYASAVQEILPKVVRVSTTFTLMLSSTRPWTKYDDNSKTS